MKRIKSALGFMFLASMVAMAAQGQGYPVKPVHIIEEPMAAAIGAGLPIEEPVGSMIVDIGGGTTDIAVISLAGIVYSKAVRVAGNEMDEAIIQYIKKTYNLLIGERTAEQIKMEIGSAFPLEERMTMEIKGRDLMEGVPKSVVVSDEEIREALDECINIIINAIDIGIGVMDDIVLIVPHEHASAQTIYGICGNGIPEFSSAETSMTPIVHHIESDGRKIYPHKHAKQDGYPSGGRKENQKNIRGD